MENILKNIFSRHTFKKVFHCFLFSTCMGSACDRTSPGEFFICFFFVFNKVMKDIFLTQKFLHSNSTLVTVNFKYILNTQEKRDIIQQTQYCFLLSCSLWQLAGPHPSPGSSAAWSVHVLLLFSHPSSLWPCRL